MVASNAGGATRSTSRAATRFRSPGVASWQKPGRSRSSGAISTAPAGTSAGLLGVCSRSVVAQTKGVSTRLS